MDDTYCMLTCNKGHCMQIYLPQVQYTTQRESAFWFQTHLNEPVSAWLAADVVPLSGAPEHEQLHQEREVSVE